MTACGATHHASAPTNFKALQAQKVALAEKLKRAVADLPPTNVVKSGTSCRGAAFATWSPDGKQIAWAGHGAICVANADGTGAHPLPQTRGGEYEQLFWVNPNLMLAGGNYIISRVPLSGKPTVFAGAGAPEYSVDAQGNRFSTSTSSDCPTCVGQATIWNTDGTYVGAIGDPKVFNDPPSLSADGKFVAYDQGGGIWIAAADGSHAREVASSGGSPIWSPTSSEIAYRTSRGLWVVRADGGSPSLVARVVGSAAWSPDGKSIASWAPGKLVVVDIATGAVQKLPFVGYPGFPTNAWSPDSKNLLVTALVSGRCWALWREPVDGSKPVLLSSCF